MPLQASGSGQQRDRRRRHHHHHHHHSASGASGGASTSGAGASTSGGAGGTRTAADTSELEPNNGHGGAAGGGPPQAASNNHEVSVRYTSQTNGIEMNGYSRRGKSQSPEVTIWVQVPSSMRNGSLNGQAWRLGKVFNENDEALINRKLPKELLLRIFSHLDVVSLCRCAQVINHLITLISIFVKNFNF